MVLLNQIHLRVCHWFSSDSFCINNNDHYLFQDSIFAIICRDLDKSGRYSSFSGKTKVKLVKKIGFNKLVNRKKIISFIFKAFPLLAFLISAGYVLIWPQLEAIVVVIAVVAITIFVIVKYMKNSESYKLTKILEYEIGNPITIQKAGELMFWVFVLVITPVVLNQAGGILFGMESEWNSAKAIWMETAENVDKLIEVH